MTSLRWEEQREGSFYGYSGTLVVAIVVNRSDGSGWAWSMENVNTRRIAPTDGEDLASADVAKAVAERSWAKWLKRAGLAPAGGPRQ